MERFSIMFDALELAPNTERFNVVLTLPRDPLGLIGEVASCTGEFSLSLLAASKPFALLTLFAVSACWSTCSAHKTQHDKPASPQCQRTECSVSLSSPDTSLKATTTRAAEDCSRVSTHRKLDGFSCCTGSEVVHPGLEARSPGSEVQ